MNGQIKKEFKMTAWKSSEIGTIRARRQQVTAFRRPLLVGALAAGVIAIGASTALAASPLGDPPPLPATAGAHSTTANMMSDASMRTMHGSTANMMSDASMRTMHGSTANMMSDARMRTMHGSTANMMSDASMRTMHGSTANMMSDASMRTMHGTTANMMGSSSTGAMGR
jgi:hypothetical protein